MQRAFLVWILAAACSGSSSPRANPEPGGGSAAAKPASGSAKPASGSAKPSGSSYAGPAHRGPCESAHDCKLRDVCGCSCEGVLLTAPSDVACEESCKGDGCQGYTVMCDLPTQTCGAIPKAP